MSKSSPVLHILQLRITNYGIIRAAAIHPDGSPVILAGDNGAGKSTVLSSIESVLFGRKLAAPVTAGQEKAQIKLELGEPGATKPIWRIEQIIKAGDKPGEAPSYNLKVFDVDNKQVPSPAKFIESLIQSGAALDPTEIMQARPGERPETFAKRQAETLMERLGLSAKAKKLDAAIEEKADERKSANDDVKRLQARLDAIDVPPGTPDAPPDVSALAERLANLKQLGTQRARIIEKNIEKASSVKNAQKRVDELQRLLDEATTALDGAVQLHAEGVNALEAFDEENPPDGMEKAIADAQAKVDSAGTVTAAVQKKQERKTVSKELAEAEASAASLHTEVEKLREDRLALIAKAKLPVEGLKLTPEALLYKGKPLVQESTGNQIRVCSELAMSEEPDCRVIFIREGALTNKANRQIVYDVADQKGWQVWEEHFSEQPLDGALWIEGGTVEE